MSDEPHLIFVRWYDHSRQNNNEEYSLDFLQLKPQSLYIFEEVGWLIYEDDNKVQVSKTRVKREREPSEFKYGDSVTILKCAIDHMCRVMSVEK